MEQSVWNTTMLEKKKVPAKAACWTSPRHNSPSSSSEFNTSEVLKGQFRRLQVHVGLEQQRRNTNTMTAAWGRRSVQWALKTPVKCTLLRVQEWFCLKWSVQWFGWRLWSSEGPPCCTKVLEWFGWRLWPSESLLCCLAAVRWVGTKSVVFRWSSLVPSSVYQHHLCCFDKSTPLFINTILVVLMLSSTPLFINTILVVLMLSSTPLFINTILVVSMKALLCLSTLSLLFRCCLALLCLSTPSLLFRWKHCSVY